VWVAGAAWRSNNILSTWYKKEFFRIVIGALEALMPRLDTNYGHFALMQRKNTDLPMMAKMYFFRQ